MQFFKKIWDKIKQPHGFWLVLFYILFVVAVTGSILLVIFIPNQTIGHYILYAVAGISLAYFVYTIVYFVPIIRRNSINLIQKFKFTNKLYQNHGYRTMLMTLFSFIFNISYVAFVFVLAIMTKSAWYLSITAYYVVLSLMKGNILYSKKKYNTEFKQARAYRFCGIMFMLLMIAFSGEIVLIYTTNMTFEYAGLMIYAVAAYTFYKLTRAIIGAIKARKRDDFYIQGLRNLNLVTALISIIVLQVAMFQAFSPQHNQSIANGLTGGGVAVIIFVIGILMIRKANKALKELREKENEKTE